jgi:endonuclease-3 related protein
MILHDLYLRLYNHYGPQQWWPANSPFEVIIGAILTQNTNWRNVEKAIANLRNADALDPVSIQNLPVTRLETLIRPSGFFRQKTVRLQQFCNFLKTEYQGDLQRLFALPLPELRNTLLNQNGIGPETADSIILYAANQPSFVVDTYTHRMLGRVGIQNERQRYEQTRALFMDKLPHETKLFNEYHALIVRLAKDYCRKRNPRCNDCPLLTLCCFGRDSMKD